MTQANFAHPLAKMLITICLLASGGASVASAELSQSERSLTEVPSSVGYVTNAILQKTNLHRKRVGLSPLRLDAALSRVAQGHARDMDRRGYFSHTSPDGETLNDRLFERKITYTTAGENIASGEMSPEEIVSMWMHSRGHRENILEDNYRRIGIGHSGGLWVQVFTD